MLLKITSGKYHRKILGTYLQYSLDQQCSVVETKHHQSSNIVNIDSNITGVMCGVITPKDKARYPCPLTRRKLNIVQDKLGLHIGLSHLKTNKDTQAPLQEKAIFFYVNDFANVNIRCYLPSQLISMPLQNCHYRFARMKSWTV